MKGKCIRFCDLKEKEVINCRDCRRLGYVADIEFDSCTGCIKAIIVPEQGKLFWCFGSAGEFYINFCDIKCIGPDIILVDICIDIPKKPEK